MDFEALANDLDAYGVACIRHLLSADDCRSIAAMYDDERLFRSHIVMARHGFGRGEYKYFSYPLPPTIGRLRADLYPPLCSDTTAQFNRAVPAFRVIFLCTIRT